MKELSDRASAAIARYRAAIAEHRAQAHRAPGNAEEVTAAGRDVLDAASELRRAEVAVVDLTSQPRPRHRSTR